MSQFNRRFITMIIIALFFVLSGSVIYSQDEETEEELPNCSLNDQQYTGAASHRMASLDVKTMISETQHEGVMEIGNLPKDLSPQQINKIITGTNKSVEIWILDDFLETHGDDVYTVASNTLASISATSNLDIEGVKILTINTAPDNTDVRAVAELNQMLNHFEQRMQPLPDKIVLNMSFVFLPCIEYLPIPGTAGLHYNLIEFFENDFYGESGIETFFERLTVDLRAELENDRSYLDGYEIDDDNQFYVYEENDIALLEEIMSGGDGALGDYIINEIDNFDFDEDKDYIYDDEIGDYREPRLRITRYIITAALIKVFELNRDRDNVLKDFLATDADTENPIFIPVAAAGNWGPGDAYSPGAWTTVISVSGNDEKNTMKLWASSNNGEIKATGAWHEISNSRYVNGTSFSAPLVSVMVGILTTYRDCTFDTFMNAQAGDFTNLYYIPELWNRNNCNNLP